MAEYTEGIGGEPEKRDSKEVPAYSNTVYHIPASPSFVELRMHTFANIVRMIPAGKLSSTDAICKMWAQRHGKKHCEIENALLPYTTDFAYRPMDITRVDTMLDIIFRPDIKDGNIIPYWRLVSVRGHLKGYGMWDKEMQKEMLEKEGHTIIKLDKGDSFVVKDYKKALFDLDSLIIKE